MQLYLALTPEEYPRFMNRSAAFVHMAYQCSPEGTLTRLPLTTGEQRGLLGLNSHGLAESADAGTLFPQLLRECRQRRYTGVFADMESACTPQRLQFFTSLAQALQKQGLSLFLPEEYAAVPGCIPLLCTAISGGCLQTYLQESLQRRGGEAAALDLQRLRMDFTLPAPSGAGHSLSPGEFQQLLAERAPSIFYSSELGAKYFTYTRSGQTHFVLFDDAQTLRNKLRLGRQLGFSAAFLMYPECSDLLEDLLPAQQKNKPLHP